MLFKNDFSFSQCNVQPIMHCVLLPSLVIEKINENTKNKKYNWKRNSFGFSPSMYSFVGFLFYLCREWAESRVVGKSDACFVHIFIIRHYCASWQHKIRIYFIIRIIVHNFGSIHLTRTKPVCSKRVGDLSILIVLKLCRSLFFFRPFLRFFSFFSPEIFL